jgi:hypothetical protein
LLILIRFFLPQFPDGARIQDMRQQPEIELTIPKLPQGATSDNVRVALAIDQSGKIVGCEAGKRERDEKLAAIVCKDKARLGLRPLSNAAGQPIAYITQAIVRVTARNP